MSYQSRKTFYKVFFNLKTDIKPCLGNPCQNGGTCIDEGLAGDYICRCKEGYNGKNCEGMFADHKALYLW